MWLYVIGAVTVAVVGAAFWVVHRVPKMNMDGKRVLITGGSAGIGLSVAKSIAQRGGHVAIAARRENVLREAVKEIKAVAKDGAQVTYVTVDVSDEESLQKAITNLNKRMGGPLDLLICSAGFSHPARFLDTPSSVVRSTMDVNYFGCVNAARAVLPNMIKQGSGRIVFVSSMASTACIAGFTSYSPSKAAVRAFAQALDMEHAALGVRAQVVNPPDVATPGYEAEMTIKSEECKRISAMGGASVFTADSMASSIIQGIENYAFQVNLGFDGWLLGTGTANMEPPSSVAQLIAEATLGGLIRFIGSVYTRLHYNIVSDVRKEEASGPAKKKN